MSYDKKYVAIRRNLMVYSIVWMLISLCQGHIHKFQVPGTDLMLTGWNISNLMFLPFLYLLLRFFQSANEEGLNDDRFKSTCRAYKERMLRGVAIQTARGRIATKFPHVNPYPIAEKNVQWHETKDAGHQFDVPFEYSDPEAKIVRQSGTIELVFVKEKEVRFLNVRAVIYAMLHSTYSTDYYFPLGLALFSAVLFLVMSIVGGFIYTIPVQ